MLWNLVIRRRVLSCLDLFRYFTLFCWFMSEPVGVFFGFGGWSHRHFFEGYYPPDRRLNRPGISEAILFESRGHGWFGQHGVVALLGFGRRDVADGLQQPAIVEPVHPFQCG